MIILFLALIDLLGAISAAALAFGHPLYHLQAAAGLGLIFKGVIFYDNIVSWMDIVIGVMLFVMFWASMPNFALAAAVYLGFKGILSFF